MRRLAYRVALTLSVAWFVVAAVVCGVGLYAGIGDGPAVGDTEEAGYYLGTYGECRYSFTIWRYGRLFYYSYPASGC